MLCVRVGVAPTALHTLCVWEGGSSTCSPHVVCEWRVAPLSLHTLCVCVWEGVARPALHTLCVWGGGGLHHLLSIHCPLVSLFDVSISFPFDVRHNIQNLIISVPDHCPFTFSFMQ